MFRLLGLSKSGLILIVLMHSMFFSIPALVISYPVSIGFLAIINFLLKMSLSVSVSIFPNADGIIWSIVLGIIIPIISSIIPLIFLFKQSLNITLDLVHSQSKGVHI